MAWSAYDYKLRPDSAGAGTDLIASGYATSVRINPEIAPGTRSAPSILPDEHGVKTVARRPYASYEFFLDIVLSYGPLTPTHADGSPGHVYENRSEVLKLLKHTEKTWLQRTAPHHGAVEIPFVVGTEVRTTNPRQRILVPCTTLDPFWREQTQRTAVNPIPSITLGGDSPVTDAVFTFTGGTNPILTHDDTGDSFQIKSPGGTDVVVDLLQGTITQGGVPVPGFLLDSNRKYLMELLPGVNNMSLTGGGSVAVDFYEKWF